MPLPLPRWCRMDRSIAIVITFATIAGCMWMHRPEKIGMRKRRNENEEVAFSVEEEEEEEGDNFSV